MDRCPVHGTEITTGGCVNCNQGVRVTTAGYGHVGQVRVLGTCSLCGGRVTVPVIWHGVNPPEPTCAQCGAVAAANGPVIPMVRCR